MIESLTLNQLIRMEDWPNVVSLIEEGADIHVAGGNGYTPLMQAVEKNVFELVELLLQKGAFINFAGREGNAPLHIAVDAAIEDYKDSFEQKAGENCEMIMFLMSHGADCFQRNDSGETPLDWVKELGSQKFVNAFELNLESKIK